MHGRSLNGRHFEHISRSLYSQLKARLPVASEINDRYVFPERISTYYYGICTYWLSVSMETASMGYLEYLWVIGELILFSKFR